MLPKYSGGGQSRIGSSYGSNSRTRQPPQQQPQQRRHHHHHHRHRHQRSHETKGLRPNGAALLLAREYNVKAVLLPDGFTLDAGKPVVPSFSNLSTRPKPFGSTVLEPERLLPTDGAPSPPHSAVRSPGWDSSLDAGSGPHRGSPPGRRVGEKPASQHAGEGGSAMPPNAIFWMEGSDRSENSVTSTSSSIRLPSFRSPSLVDTLVSSHSPSAAKAVWQPQRKEERPPIPRPPATLDGKTPRLAPPPPRPPHVMNGVGMAKLQAGGIPHPEKSRSSSSSSGSSSGSSSASAAEHVVLGQRPKSFGGHFGSKIDRLHHHHYPMVIRKAKEEELAQRKALLDTEKLAAIEEALLEEEEAERMKRRKSYQVLTLTPSPSSRRTSFGLPVRFGFDEDVSAAEHLSHVLLEAAVAAAAAGGGGGGGGMPTPSSSTAIASAERSPLWWSKSSVEQRASLKEGAGRALPASSRGDAAVSGRLLHPNDENAAPQERRTSSSSSGSGSPHHTIGVASTRSDALKKETEKKETSSAPQQVFSWYHEASEATTSTSEGVSSPVSTAYCGAAAQSMLSSSYTAPLEDEDEGVAVQWEDYDPEEQRARQRLISQRRNSRLLNGAPSFLPRRFSSGVVAAGGRRSPRRRGSSGGAGVEIPLGPGPQTSDAEAGERGVEDGELRRTERETDKAERMAEAAMEAIRSGALERIADNAADVRHSALEARVPHQPFRASLSAGSGAPVPPSGTRDEGMEPTHDAALGNAVPISCRVVDLVTPPLPAVPTLGATASLGGLSGRLRESLGPPESFSSSDPIMRRPLTEEDDRREGSPAPASTKPPRYHPVTRKASNSLSQSITYSQSSSPRSSSSAPRPRAAHQTVQNVDSRRKNSGARRRSKRVPLTAEQLDAAQRWKQLMQEIHQHSSPATSQPRQRPTPSSSSFDVGAAPRARVSVDEPEDVVLRVPAGRTTASDVERPAASPLKSAGSSATTGVSPPRGGGVVVGQEEERSEDVKARRKKETASARESEVVLPESLFAFSPTSEPKTTVPHALSGDPITSTPKPLSVPQPEETNQQEGSLPTCLPPPSPPATTARHGVLYQMGEPPAPHPSAEQAREPEPKEKKEDEEEVLKARKADHERGPVGKDSNPSEQIQRGGVAMTERESNVITVVQKSGLSPFPPPPSRSVIPDDDVLKTMITQSMTAGVPSLPVAKGSGAPLLIFPFPKLTSTSPNSIPTTHSSSSACTASGGATAPCPSTTPTTPSTDVVSTTMSSSPQLIVSFSQRTPHTPPHPPSSFASTFSSAANPHQTVGTTAGNHPSHTHSSSVATNTTSSASSDTCGVTTATTDHHTPPSTVPFPLSASLGQLPPGPKSSRGCEIAPPQHPTRIAYTLGATSVRGGTYAATASRSASRSPNNTSNTLNVGRGASALKLDEETLVRGTTTTTNRTTSPHTSKQRNSFLQPSSSPPPPSSSPPASALVDSPEFGKPSYPPPSPSLKTEGKDSDESGAPNTSSPRRNKCQIVLRTKNPSPPSAFRVGHPLQYPASPHAFDALHRRRPQSHRDESTLSAAISRGSFPSSHSASLHSTALALTLLRSMSGSSPLHHSTHANHHNGNRTAGDENAHPNGSKPIEGGPPYATTTLLTGSGASSNPFSDSRLPAIHSSSTPEPPHSHRLHLRGGGAPHNGSGSSYFSTAPRNPRSSPGGVGHGDAGLTSHSAPVPELQPIATRATSSTMGCEASRTKGSVETLASNPLPPPTGGAAKYKNGEDDGTRISFVRNGPPRSRAQLHPASSEPEQPPSPLQDLTEAQLQAFLAQSPQRCICVIDQQLYDVSYFLADHPGGPNILRKYNGKECGEAFHRIHGLRGIEKAKRYLVGRLVREATPPLQQSQRLHGRHWKSPSPAADPPTRSPRTELQRSHVRGPPAPLPSAPDAALGGSGCVPPARPVPPPPGRQSTRLLAVRHPSPRSGTLRGQHERRVNDDNGTLPCDETVRCLTFSCPNAEPLHMTPGASLRFFVGHLREADEAAGETPIPASFRNEYREEVAACGADSPRTASTASSLSPSLAATPTSCHPAPPGDFTLPTTEEGGCYFVPYLLEATQFHVCVRRPRNPQSPAARFFYLQPGEEVFFDGPYLPKYRLERDVALFPHGLLPSARGPPRHLLMIAGGVGIAMLFPILLALRQQFRHVVEVTLVLAVRSPSHLLLTEEIEPLARESRKPAAVTLTTTTTTAEAAHRKKRWTKEEEERLPHGEPHERGFGRESTEVYLSHHASSSFASHKSSTVEETPPPSEEELRATTAMALPSPSFALPLHVHCVFSRYGTLAAPPSAAAVAQQTMIPSALYEWTESCYTARLNTAVLVAALRVSHQHRPSTSGRTPVPPTRDAFDGHSSEEVHSVVICGSKGFEEAARHAVVEAGICETDANICVV